MSKPKKKKKQSKANVCLCFFLEVVFFGDNVPKDRAHKAMEAAKNCDAFLVLGSSVMTMSAYRLVRYTYQGFLLSDLVL